MTKPELLATMRLLAALESWAWAQGKPLPAYLSADIQAAVTALERELLT